MRFLLGGFCQKNSETPIIDIKRQAWEVERIARPPNIQIRGEASCSFIWGCRQLTFTRVIDNAIVVESQTVTPSCSNWIWAVSVEKIYGAIEIINR